MVTCCQCSVEYVELASKVLLYVCSYISPPITAILYCGSVVFRNEVEQIGLYNIKSSHS